MYLAMCSLRVKTEPWPMGALGPRNAVGANCQRRIRYHVSRMTY